jgi:hypothetical protein
MATHVDIETAARYGLAASAEPNRYNGPLGLGRMAVSGQLLQVLCRRARCEVRFDPKTNLIPIPNPVAICLLRTLHYRRPSRFIRLPRPTGWAFIHPGAGPERRRTKGY